MMQIDFKLATCLLTLIKRLNRKLSSYSTAIFDFYLFVKQKYELMKIIDYQRHKLSISQFKEIESINSFHINNLFDTL